MRIVNRINREAVLEFESLVNVPFAPGRDFERQRAIVLETVRDALSKGRGRWPDDLLTKRDGTLSEYRARILKDVEMTWEVEDSRNWFGRRTRTVTILSFTRLTSADPETPGQ